jgi:hypothetical protein
MVGHQNKNMELLERLERKHKALVVLCAFLATLTISASPYNHLCALNSWKIEVPLSVLSIVGIPVLCATARTPKWAWVRAILAILVLALLHMGYLRWLHSPGFPQELLNTVIEISE